MPNHEKYLELKERGICTQCQVKPAMTKNVDGVERTLTYCHECYVNWSKRRIAAQGKRICTTCLNNPAAPWKKKCKECLERDKLQIRTRRKELLAEGLCSQCGKKELSLTSRIYCDDCLTWYNTKKMQRRQELRDSGICIRCWKRPIIGSEEGSGRNVKHGESTYYCVECLEKVRKLNQRRFKKNVPGPSSEFRKKKTANEKPINIGARIGADKEFEESFGVFSKGKII